MIFEFNWNWFEDYCPNLFEHPDKTAEEFEVDCKKALRECFDEYMKDQDAWVGVNDWVEFACGTLKSYGYIPVVTVSYGLFGGYIVDKHSKDSKLLRDFPEEIQKMVKHNEAYRKIHDVKYCVEYNDAKYSTE